jgi:lipopolysaccharide/colanic/teichoic acid biosynthesis glycosyltransferase
LEVVTSKDVNIDKLKKTAAVVYDEKILCTDYNLLLEKLKLSGVSVYSYNQYFEFIYKKVDLENIYLEDLMRQIGERKETGGHFLFRRFLDILCAVAIYPIYLFFKPLVYLAIYFQDRKALFTKQDRVGLLGAAVWLYKFRTMTDTDSGGIVADDANKNTATKHGNVVTPLGKVLRKTRIDELPQCYNLLRGDISMIGPRADIIGVYKDMCQHIENYSLRLLVPQGLTGWAQTHMNFPPRTHEEHKERLKYDLYYIKYRSLFLDIAIILKTIKTVLSREGA